MSAIHDAISSAGPTTGSSLSWSHTNGGGVPTNGTLLVWGWTNTATNVVTSVTYNGVAPAETLFTNSASESYYIWRWASPASGAHTVVINTSTSVSIAGTAWSFTAAAQGNLSFTAFGSTASATSITLSVDTVVDDSVAGMFAANSVGVPSGVGGSNTARNLTNQRGSATQVTNVVATPTQVYPSFTIDVAASWVAASFALGPYVAPGGGGGGVAKLAMVLNRRRRT